MKTVFVDVDTQLDFISPAGALYVAGAEEIAPSVAALTRFAARSGIQILSTADAHSENDPEFEIWQPHCVIGTQGQQRYSQTLLDGATVIDEQSSIELMGTEVLAARQIIVHKRTIDVFLNLNLRRVVDTLQADRFIVYGLVTEYCVRSAALGLLERKARVEIVTDAIKSLSATDGRETLERFQAGGGRLVTLSEIVSPSAQE